MTGGGPWRMPAGNCLACGGLVTGAASPIYSQRPSPGDFSMCLYCGHVMIFGFDLSLRDLATLEELIEAANDPDIAKMQRIRRETQPHR